MKMLKKATALFCTLVLSLTLAGCANDTGNSYYTANEFSAAKMLYCVEDEEILLAENENSRISCASITKLLTACTALKFADPGEIFTVGTEQELVGEHASRCFISQGQRLSLYDLITGMLMVSGSDAAYTVAVSAARVVYPEKMLSDKAAVKCFCGLMNETAYEIGMENSNFVNPDGQDDTKQYTTASDIEKLAEYSLSFPEIREIASTQQKFVTFESGECITWTNSNKLLDPESRFYTEDAIGLKTGTTNLAGNCLAAAFWRGGKTYISVAVGCESDDKRYSLTLDMLQYIVSSKQ